MGSSRACTACRSAILGASIDTSSPGLTFWEEVIVMAKRERATFAGVEFALAGRNTVPKPALAKILRSGRAYVYCCGEYSDDYAWDNAVGYRRGQRVVNEELIRDFTRSFPSVWLDAEGERHPNRNG